MDLTPYFLRRVVERMHGLKVYGKRDYLKRNIISTRKNFVQCPTAPKRAALQWWNGSTKMAQRRISCSRISMGTQALVMPAVSFHSHYYRQFQTSRSCLSLFFYQMGVILSAVAGCTHLVHPILPQRSCVVVITVAHHPSSWQAWKDVCMWWSGCTTRLVLLKMFASWMMQDDHHITVQRASSTWKLANGSYVFECGGG